MFPKTVMAVIGSEQDTSALDRAIALSAQHQSHLSVTVIGIALVASTAIYGAIPADTWSEEREKDRESTIAQAEKIEKMLAEAEISGDVSPYYCDEGQIAGVVGARAHYADLCLSMPVDDADRRFAGKALEGFLFHSAKPMLMVPESVTPTLTPDTVMIAWNSTKEAARAVHLSLDVLIRAKAVHIAMVDPIAAEFEQGEEPGFDIAAYLARHRIQVTVDPIPSEGRTLAEALLRHASDISAQTVVAGAYGHSRLREFLFGGTTRELLANKSLPILTAH